MNKLFLVSCCLFLPFFTSFAVTIKVEEKIVKYSNGKHNALQVNIMGVEEKEVLKAWAKKMKSMKGKVEKKRHEVIGMGAIYYDVHHYPGNYYGRTKQHETHVAFSVAVDLEGKFVSSSSNSKAYAALEVMIISFSKEVIRNQVQKEKQEAEKQLSAQEKELQKLKKKNEKLHQHIEKWKSSIKLAESELIENESDQKKQVQVIIDQQEKVNSIRKKESEI